MMKEESKEKGDGKDFTIYLNRGASSHSLCSKVVRLKTLLVLKGVEPDEVEEVDVTYNFSLQQSLLEPYNNQISAFPLVFFRGTPIGTIDQLERWIADKSWDDKKRGDHQTREQNIEKLYQGVLQQKQAMVEEKEKALRDASPNANLVEELNGSIQQLVTTASSIASHINANQKRSPGYVDFSPPESTSVSPQNSGLLGNPVTHATTSSQPTNISVHSSPRSSQPSSLTSSSISNPARMELGYVSTALDYTEWALGGVASYLGSYYPAQNSGLTPDQSKYLVDTRVEEPAAAEYIEFEVIQTNWYWRQQKRWLRFYKDHFERINPQTGDTRASKNYTDVTKITISTNSKLILWFGTEGEYYDTMEARKVVQVLENYAAKLHHKIQIQLG